MPENYFGGNSFRLSQAPSVSPLLQFGYKISHTLVLSDDPIAGHHL
jgi:hypothetical protein